MEEHDIDVAEGIQLAAAIAADGDEGKVVEIGVLCFCNGAVEEMAEDDIDQAGALAGDLAAAAFGVMGEAEAMVLYLEEALVESEELCGALLALEGELSLGVGENFFAVAGDGIGAAKAGGISEDACGCFFIRRHG
jgi:hypothetical protein